MNLQESSFMIQPKSLFLRLYLLGFFSINKNPTYYLLKRKWLPKKQREQMDWSFFSRHPFFATQINDFNHLSPALRYTLLQNAPELIKKVKMPTDLECWTILQQDPKYITQLSHLSFEQLEYFLKRGESLRWIKYHKKSLELLSERLMFRAIQINPNHLQYCDHQTERLCLEAIKQDPYQYQFSKHLTFESGLESLKKSKQGLSDFTKCDSSLTKEEQVELKLIASIESVRHQLNSKNRQLQMIQREQKVLREEIQPLFSYQHEHQIGVLKLPTNPYCMQNQLTGEWLTVEAGIENTPLTLALLPNYLKDYRLCRLAVARQKQSRYFSPYHIGELYLMEK